METRHLPQREPWTLSVDDKAHNPQAYGNTYGARKYTQTHTQLYKWLEGLFYKMRGEYFMSNWAKFRLQLQGYFECLIKLVCYRLPTGFPEKFFFDLSLYCDRTAERRQENWEKDQGDNPPQWMALRQIRTREHGLPVQPSELTWPLIKPVSQWSTFSHIMEIYTHITSTFCAFWTVEPASHLSQTRAAHINQPSL